MMSQRKLDQLRVQAGRRHKTRMEKLNLAYLGKRADVARDEFGREVPQDDLAEEAFDGV